MREIKFRAWDSHNNTMQEWNYLKTWAPCYWEGLPIMQYTGLKDKNGKEVYEGDIVQFNERHKSITKVYMHKSGEWRVDHYREGSIPLYKEERFIEVIGNIYENKELLMKD
jgi:uncharacterized phage protein (TIGR01671 family)